MAETYYIHPDGDDAADGTSPQNAWRTLARVYQQPLFPGDSVLLAGGAQFTGNLYLGPQQKGSQQNPLVISSYGTGWATIRADSTTGVYIHNTAGIRLEKLEIAGLGRANNQGHGILFYLDSAQTAHLSGIWVDQVRVHGFNQGGLTVYAHDTLETGFAHIRINRVESYDNGDHGISIGGKVRDTGHVHRDIHIRDCIARDNPGQIGKTWSHTGSGIVVGNSEAVLVEYCQAYRNGGESSNTTGGPVGIWLWDTRAGIIQHCESHHNDTGSTKDGGGFDLDGGCQDCVIQYCYAHDNAGPGYLLAEYNGARPLQNCAIRFNISENDARKHFHGALVLWRGDGILQDIDIYHNTFYLSQSSGRTLPVAWLSSTGMENIRFINNVLIAGDDCLLVKSISGDEAVQFTGNAYHSQGSFVAEMSGQSYATLPAWQAATGQETWQNQPQGLVGDPALEAPGQGGTLGDPYNLPALTAYRLQAHSPLRGAAWSDHGLDLGPQDALGQVLGAAPLDIGAVQYRLKTALAPLSPDRPWLWQATSTGYQIARPEGHSGPARLEIWDTQGRQLAQQTLPPFVAQHDLDLAAYPPGTYVVRLIVGDWIGVEKVAR